MSVATLPIACAAGRLLFNTEVAKGKAGGASDAVVYARAWVALERAGWEPDPEDNVWKAGGWSKQPRVGPPNAEKAATLAALLARVDALIGDAMGKAFNPHQMRVPSGPKGEQFSGGGGGGGMFAAEGLDAPQFGTKPDPFLVLNPTSPTAIGDNANPEDVAVFVAGHAPGDGLNGVAFAEWTPPTTTQGWAAVEGQAKIDEPPFPKVEGKRPGSGVIIEEPDGRVWVVEPTNHYGGYEHSFPKGGLEKGMSPQANAIKETFEEAGLKVQITGYVGDFERTTSIARYYTGRRVGGSPAAHGEESQAVKLVPKADLAEFANHKADAPIVERILGVSKALVAAIQAASRMDSVEKAGGWSKQPRVPTGAKGGQWTTYGGGGFGGAMAASGAALELQQVTGKNPDHPSLVKAQKATALFQAEANAGNVKFFADLEASGKAPKPAVQTYASKTYANYVEAKSYATAKAAGGGADSGSAGPKATPAAAAATKPASGAVAGHGGVPKDNLTDLKKVGEKPGGTAAGGIYEDASGQKWLVKAYATSDQARQEVLAADLYKMVGTPAPDMKLVATQGVFPGKGDVGVMSKWEDSAQPLNPGNAAHITEARKGFAADAWLGNWDAVGLSNDNMVMVPGKGMVRIDPGGSLEYRAMGTKKGAAWNKEASEWDTLRDPSKNPSSAKVFAAMNGNELKASATALVYAQDSDIKAMTAKHLPAGEAAKMADTLIARRDAILLKSGVDEPHAKAPGALALGGTNKAAAAADSPAAGVLPEPPTFTGKYGSTFYGIQAKKLNDAARAGDFATASKLAAYSPTSWSGKNSVNFAAYKAHADSVLSSMQAKADAVPAHMGPASKPVAGPMSPSKVGPVPDKFVVTSAANAGQQKKFDAIHEMGLKGDVDGIAAMSYGTNTYGIQQTKKANEWLVQNGYAPSVFPGMNTKSDPAKGSYKAVPSVPGATPKAAISAAPAIAAAGGNPAPPVFNPAQISAAPNFNNLGSGGGPLSSVQAVNDSNNSAVKLIHSTALTGDMQALNSLTYAELDKGTGQPTGKQIPVSNHPSQHVKAYLNDLLNEVDFQLNPPAKPDIGNVVAGSSFDAFKHLLPVPSGKAIAAVPESQKAGYYIALGKVTGPLPKVKADNSVAASAQWIKQAQAHVEKSPSAAKSSMYDYVGQGSGWMNTNLQKGIEDAKTKDAVKNIRSLMIDIPEGTTFTRSMGEKGYNKISSAAVIKKLQQQILSADAGTVWQEPGFSSSSWSGGKSILKNNDILWQFTAGKGVKAVPAWTGLNSGEGEALFPPNQRYLILGSKKVGKTVVVDAILLPDLEG